jgi:hypothetical protein
VQLAAIDALCARLILLKRQLPKNGGERKALTSR